jgi:aryl sulfotransferase
MTEAVVQPTKTRELHNHHFDSTIWNDFSFRHDDVVVATYAKSGTTWTQQIVAQLLLGPDPDLAVAEISPWIDLRIPPKEVKLPVVEAQTHRRFLKTHLPLDALVFSPKAKYIYIARDGRDVVWSIYNHHVNANHLWYEALNETPGRVGPPIEPPPADIRRYFRDWLERDGHPFWPFWENVRTWWEVRHLPNVLFVHFANLKRDMPGQMRRLADFLAVPVEEARWEETVEYCSFGWMKRNAAKVAPLGGPHGTRVPRCSSTEGSTAAGRRLSRLRTSPSTRGGPSGRSVPSARGGSPRERGARDLLESGVVLGGELDLIPGREVLAYVLLALVAEQGDEGTEVWVGLAHLPRGYKVGAARWADEEAVLAGEASHLADGLL